MRARPGVGGVVRGALLAAVVLALVAGLSATGAASAAPVAGPVAAHPASPIADPRCREPMTRCTTHPDGSFSAESKGGTWVEKGRCGGLFYTGSLSGSGPGGFAPNWSLLVSPNSTAASCTFSGRVSALRASGGAPYTQSFRGSFADRRSMTQGVGDDDLNSIRPQTITVSVCDGGDCSPPLSGTA